MKERLKKVLKLGKHAALRGIGNLGRVQFSWIRKELAGFPKKERVVVALCAILLVVSFSVIVIFSTVAGGQHIPARGGTHREGLIGNPRFINPVLAQANEVDRTLVKLVYPSLLAHSPDGELVPFLANNYAIGDSGKVYEFTLKEGATWEDGEPIRARDVVFTIEKIQDQSIGSPLNRVWNGVEVEALDEKTVRFTLSAPYAFFLQNATVGILPSHIWQSIGNNEFTSTPLNLNPLGAGPYKIEGISQIDGQVRSMNFTRNETFFGAGPFIDHITFNFYGNSDELVEALDKNEVDSIPVTSIGLLEEVESKGVAIHSFSLPRYFAIFLNGEQNEALKTKEVRQALSFAINKQKIIDDILKGFAKESFTPITPALKKYYKANVAHYEHNVAQAREMLQEQGWGGENVLTIELTVIDNDALTAIANQIVEDWGQVGVEVTLRRLGLNVIQEEVLQKRSYQAFLFGQGLALEPDPFSLWHSSQKQHPGFNLSSYSNNDLDIILETMRKTFDPQAQEELFTNFQTIMAEDLPAIFLYSPNHLVATRTKTKGVIAGVLSLPEDRFDQVSQWYINTARAK